MAVMTIAICDEIRKDAQKLYRQLSTLVPDAELILYRTRESLLKGLAEGHKICDLIFLGLDGDQGRSLETVRTMRLKGHYIPVVLVAENEKFYKEAFEVFAYNYLVKPVESGELEHVLVHILEVCRREGGRALYFRYRKQVYTLQHDHLAYISSSLHSVTFHLTDGKKISCRARLGDFSGQLSDSSFLRCHQSFCINMEKFCGRTDGNPNFQNISENGQKEIQRLSGRAEGLLLTAPFGYVTITIRFHVVE